MNRVVVVTGGSRGIGLGVVKQFLKEGCSVVTMSRSKENIEPEFKKVLEENPDNLAYIEGDVGIHEDRQRLIDLVIERFGRIDVLVNNAGVAPKKRDDLLDVTEESWDYVLDVNLRGTMFMSQLAVKAMLKNELVNGARGYIINLGSLSSYASSSNRVAYCASKAAVEMLTKVYAERFAGDGIYVYTVRPGVIDTSMTKVVHDKYTKMIEEGHFPIARWGYPEDLGLAISTLCEGKLLYSTGDTINVDGGFHIRRL